MGGGGGALSSRALAPTITQYLNSGRVDSFDMHPHSFSLAGRDVF